MGIYFNNTTAEEDKLFIFLFNKLMENRTKILFY